MRLLIIEDERDLLTSLAQALREAGYAVDTAGDGGEGLYKAECADYDAIVLDVMLPAIDGWEVLKRLRKTKNTPVLMLTARDSARDRVRGLDSGADDYLAKPFDLDELLARLRALIRRYAGQPNSIIEVGAVSINMASRQVTLGREIVPLTRGSMLWSNFWPCTAENWSLAPRFMNTSTTRTTIRFPIFSTCMYPTSAKNWGPNSSPQGAVTVIASHEADPLAPLADAALAWVGAAPGPDGIRIYCVAPAI